jgi:hypothetical protein
MRFSTRQFFWAATFVILVFVAIAYARMPSARERKYLHCQRNLSTSLDRAINQLVSTDQAYSVIKILPEEYPESLDHRLRRGGVLAQDWRRFRVNGVAKNVLADIAVGRATGDERGTRMVLYPWFSVESAVKSTPAFEYTLDSGGTPVEWSVAHNMIPAYTCTLSKKTNPKNKTHRFMAWNCDGAWTTISDKVPVGKYFARVDLYVFDSDKDFEFHQLEKLIAAVLKAAESSAEACKQID